MTKEEVVALLQKYKLQPRREQGQNFLISDEAVHASIEAAGLAPDSIVLEIGPGLGVLTRELVVGAGAVIAVEQDRNVIPLLHLIRKAHPNLTIVNQDIRTANLKEYGLQDKNYTLVSNLPYSITSWVLRQFTEHEPRPHTAVLMVQKEVAQRVIATPGQMSVLGAAVQLYTEPEIIAIVPRRSFYPVPKVDSAIIRLRARTQPLSQDPEALMKLVKVGFSSKRKQLHNNIQAGLNISAAEAKELLEKCHINPSTRAQELSLQQWESLRMNV